MNTATERRGITYSAEAVGDRGILRCHVIRHQLAYDDRAQYSIAVSNETDADAQAIAFVPELPDQYYRTIVQTVIGPRSDFSTTVALDLEHAGVMPEIRVAIAGGDIAFTLSVPHRPAEPALATTPVALTNGGALRPLASTTLDAYAPRLATRPEATLRSHQFVRETPRSRSSPAITPILLFFAALLCVVAFLVFRPQIARLELPRSAQAKTAVTMSYRATGLGTPRYSVLGPDGQTLVAGRLPLGSGTFAVTFPSAPAAQAYLVRLRMSSILGSAIAEDYVHVAASALPSATPRPQRARAPVSIAPPQIRSLAVDRATVTGGDTLTVYYDVLAASGTIALVDPASQITYGKSELAASGHTAFAVPRVDSARFFTVVVSATRGTATTQSRTGVSVTPLDAPASAPAAQAGSSNPDEFGVGGTTVGTPSETVIAAPATVRSGQTIRVVISGAAAGTQLVFLDESGAELARRDVATGTSSANFVAPRVRVPSRYLFEATNPRGGGSETIVRAIAVMP